MWRKTVQKPVSHILFSLKKHRFFSYPQTTASKSVLLVSLVYQFPENEIQTLFILWKTFFYRVNSNYKCFDYEEHRKNLGHVIHHNLGVSPIGRG